MDRLRALAQHLSPSPAAAGPAGGRPCISTAEENLVASFLTAPAFAVVGASKDRQKFGNKILRCYLQHDKAATPVSPKEPEVEQVAAVKAVGEVAAEDISKIGVSVITPPPVTLGVLEELSELGISKVWLQPGAESDEVVVRAAPAPSPPVPGHPACPCPLLRRAGTRWSSSCSSGTGWATPPWRSHTVSAPTSPPSLASSPCLPMM